MADEVEIDLGGVEFGESFTEESLPFLAEDKHEGRVTGWGVNGSKGHDVESKEDALGPGEA